MKGLARVFRFNPLVDRESYFQHFEFACHEGMTVLDVLNGIREGQDPSLEFSRCCRNGQCGLCGMRVNGKEVLACRHPAAKTLEIAPLEGFQILKDLVILRDEYEARRPQLRLFLERREGPLSEPERVDMEAFDLFKRASRCIECMCCVSACPVMKENPHGFAGPMALALLARHHFDPRDDLDRALMARDEGIRYCVDCGLCSRVCPQAVDPARLIGIMKKAVESKGPSRSR